MTPKHKWLQIFVFALAGRCVAGARGWVCPKKLLQICATLTGHTSGESNGANVTWHWSTSRRLLRPSESLSHDFLMVFDRASPKSGL
jgi:hypothetical protein